MIAILHELEETKTVRTHSDPSIISHVHTHTYTQTQTHTHTLAEFATIK